MKTNYRDLFNLTDYEVYVVGGSGLIGSQIVKALEEFGALVTVFDFDIKKKSNSLSTKYVKFNCENEKNIKNFFTNYIKKYKCPDVFINASYPVSKDWKKNTFKEINFNSYKKNIEIHLNSYVWIAKTIADQMKKKKIRGSIIQLSSMYGLVAQDDNLYKDTNISENMTYGIIKSSTIHFTKQMASHYGKNNIRVNNLVIGGIKGHIKGSKQKQDKNFLKKFNLKVPLKRMGTSQEIPSSIIFLASPASSYITGSNIVIDGGYSII
jgi:NAD(P)-dependent dehydrogenase (short-subunit alcohol dehydrogenase family)